MRGFFVPKCPSALTLSSYHATRPIGPGTGIGLGKGIGVGTTIGRSIIGVNFVSAIGSTTISFVISCPPFIYNKSEPSGLFSTNSKTAFFYRYPRQAAVPRVRNFFGYPCYIVKHLLQVELKITGT